MNKILVLYDIYEDVTFFPVIIGGHYTKGRAYEILIKNNAISEDNNLKIIDISYGWAKLVYNLEEHFGTDVKCNIGYIWELCEKQPDGYNRKTTFVDLAEKESVLKLIETK